MSTAIINDHPNNDIAPVASTDPDLVLDVDFTAGETAVDAILVTAEGFEKQGTPSGEDWDATLGLNTNATFGYRVLNWSPSALASRADIYANGAITLYWEVKRNALASTYKDDLNGFVDNDDGPSINDEADFTPGANVQRYIMDITDPDAVPYPGIRLNGNMTWDSGTTPQSPKFRLVTQIIDTALDNISIRLHKNVASQLGDYVKIMQVINTKSGTFSTYIDGILVWRTDWNETFGDDANKTDIFKRLSLLQAYGGASRFKGYVKRFQIIKRACMNDSGSFKVGIIGDSIVQRAGGGYVVADPADEAAILAEQDLLDNSYARNTGSASTNPLFGYTYNPWGWQLSTISASNGCPFRLYYSGDTGHYWSAGANQIASHYIDAVVTYDPDIVILLGSVNDVSATNSAAAVKAGLTSYIDTIIAGCTNLKRIILLTTPSMDGDDDLITTAQQTRYSEHVAAQIELDGYGDIVTVYDLFSGMGGTNFNSTYSTGNHPNYTAWRALAVEAGNSPAPVGQDVHPAQTGQSKMAELAWETLKNHLFRY